MGKFPPENIQGSLISHSDSIINQTPIPLPSKKYMSRTENENVWCKKKSPMDRICLEELVSVSQKQ